MNTSGGFAYLAWPLVVIGGFAVMVLALRWAFSPGRSLVERRPRAGSPGEYGLLVPVAAPSSPSEGERLRSHLESSGVRATLVTTTAGHRLMVFDQDAAIARALLSAGPPPPDAP